LKFSLRFSIYLFSQLLYWSTIFIEKKLYCHEYEIRIGK
jgi:hypothetical protein